MAIYGASGTDPLLESMGVLKTLGGSTKAGQQAIDFANQLYPQVEEADPWEAAFQFFTEMGRQASQPGATALGAAVSSGQAPMDYLNAKKREKTETDRARMQTAVQIAPSLKPKPRTGSGTSVMVVDPATGKPRYMSSSEAIRTGAEPYIKPTATSSTYKEQKFYKTGFPAAVVKNSGDAAGFNSAGWSTVPPEGWKPPAGSKTSATVQSSKILDGNVTVSLFNDGAKEVRNDLGEIVTGEAARLAVQEAEDRGIEIQTERAGGRAAATFAIKASGEAFDNILSSRTNIANLREAKRLILEEGANTGFIVDNFPSWKDSTIALDNVKNRLGLDVVGSVTFGALSASELDLALNTALPTNKTEAGLVEWIEDKIVAQEKLQDYLYKQATFLSDGDKTIGDWLRKQKADQEESEREEAVRRQAGTDFDFTNMTAAEIVEIDMSTLSATQLADWNRRMDELGL